MAGSKKWFQYVTDAGDTFAMEMDESNGEAVNNVDMTAANLERYAVPSNVRKRYALYRSTDGYTQRKIWVSTVALLAAAPSTITVPDYTGTDTTLNLTYPVGERTALPKAADSGLNDGDDT